MIDISEIPVIEGSTFSITCNVTSCLIHRYIICDSCGHKEYFS